VGPAHAALIVQPTARRIDSRAHILSTSLTGSPTGSPDHGFPLFTRLARLRWTIELDYRQLKGELGLDHYEGRSYAGFQHHTALVTCAPAFLTEERGGEASAEAGGDTR
jgi:SRSO17 transposase